MEAPGSGAAVVLPRTVAVGHTAASLGVIPDAELRRGIWWLSRGPPDLESGLHVVCPKPRAEPPRLSHSWVERATRSPQERKQWVNRRRRAGRAHRARAASTSESLRGSKRRRRGTTAPPLCSDALEDFRPSHLHHAAVRGDVGRDRSCRNGRRIDEASRPDRGHVAIPRPVPRRLEHHARASNASRQLIRNSRTGARRAADENSGEISRRVDAQNLQQRAALTPPDGRQQALRRRRNDGCDQEKQSGDDTGHALSPSGDLLVPANCRHE